MSGFKFTVRLMIQLLVATTRAILRSVPSGKKAHNTVAIAASPSSATTPAAAMANRLRLELSRYESLTSE